LSGLIIRRIRSVSNPAVDITWHQSAVGAGERALITRARPTIVWLTGLSGSGKSTIAAALEATLVQASHAAYLLDGDNIRHGLNRDLGFSPEARTENIRRIGEVAKLFADASIIAIASFISPYRADRAAVRALAPDAFLEVWIDTPLELCEQRDPKGLYKKARAGIAAGKPMAFTGLDAPYEVPEKPELRIETQSLSVSNAVRAIWDLLVERDRLLPHKGHVESITIPGVGSAR
jgi:adenylyl-sulfate kinase